MKIKPRKNQILIKPDEEQSRTSEHGIITPSSVEQEKKSLGTVIAVGEDIKDIKVDDRVIYAMYAGDKISLDDSSKDVDFLIVLDEDVLAFIEEE